MRFRGSARSPTHMRRGEAAPSKRFGRLAAVCPPGRAWPYLPTPLSRCGQPAGAICKPGSVLLLPTGATIPLGRRLPAASSDQPGWRGRFLPCAAVLPRVPSLFGLAPGGVCPYSVLLPVGFAVPLRLPVARCALAAPFHPCLSAACPLPNTGPHRRSLLCGTVPCRSVESLRRHRRRALPGTVFRGARTFLGRRDA